MNYHQRDLKELQQIIDAIPRPFYRQHPLLFSWTFWIYRQQTPTFAQNLTRFVTVRTGEQFFRVFNYIKSANDMSLNMGIYIFKENIRPMWEDSANKYGGRWFINSKKEEDTDKLWLEILFVMIGEQFGEHNKHINGAFIVSKNSFNRVGIWLKDALSKNSCIQIGKILKNVTKVDHIDFEAHDSVQKIRYEIN